MSGCRVCDSGFRAKEIKGSEILVTLGFRSCRA